MPPASIVFFTSLPGMFSGCGWKKSRAINSTLDVEIVLTTIVAKAVQLR
jgi:hypothetical protein